MKKFFAFLCTVILLGAGSAHAADADSARIEALEKKLEMLLSEIDSLKKEQAQARAAAEAESSVAPEAAAQQKPAMSAFDRFSFGGYGEVHANMVEGGSGDKLDLHRFVAFIGYDFADWIKLQSEVEIEHAFVKDNVGGELSIEQLYTDFLLNRYANVRVRRVLAPLGITNQRHEPTAIFGVERPSFDRVILPSTWSMDGIGLFGNITDNLSYQVYGVAGLDGSKFTAANGIRDGRIKESPSLNDLAVAGRLDWHPLIDTDLTVGQDLKLGLSGYFGGYDNGNNGMDPGKEGNVTIYSGDFETRIWDVDLRGAAALIDISNARQFGAKGVAEQMLGWYAEAGWHFWPQALKKGKLERSDAILFARYDSHNTQFKMPTGVKKTSSADRSEWTLGLNFYPVPNFVAKADYQIRESEAAKKAENLINLGVGWQF